MTSNEIFKFHNIAQLISVENINKNYLNPQKNHKVEAMSTSIGTSIKLRILLKVMKYFKPCTMNF